MNNEIHKDQCINIKKIIERLSGVLDIGIESRKRPIPDLKKVYCKLCRTKTKASLNTIAKALHPEYNHSSVLAANKEFDQLSERNQFPLTEIYEIAKTEIKESKNQPIKYTKFRRDLILNNFALFYEEQRLLTPEETDPSFYIEKFNSENNFN